MDSVILLFRLIMRITTSEGVPHRPRLHVDPAQGGSVSVQHLSLGVCSNQTVIIDTRTRWAQLAFLQWLPTPRLGLGDSSQCDPGSIRLNRIVVCCSMLPEAMALCGLSYP